MYEIPALYFQKGATNLLLDPIGYDMPGAEGAADLYLMPAYAPTTSLYFEEGQWKIYHAAPVVHTNAHTMTKPQVMALSAATINQLLNSIAEDAILSI